MTSTHRPWTIAAVVLCLGSAPFSRTVSASGQQPVSSTADAAGAATTTDRAPAPRSLFALSDDQLLASAPPDASPWRGTSGAAIADSRQWGHHGHRGHGHGGDNGAAQAAIIIGAAAAIAGTAILVYANRPDCGNRLEPDGCGYGTKVVGGSLIAGGVVSLVVGAATWR
jgi:hypothetical protein